MSCDVRSRSALTANVIVARISTTTTKLRGLAEDDTGNAAGRYA